MKIEGVVRVLEHYTFNRLILDENAILNIISVFLNENNLHGILNDFKFVKFTSFKYSGLYEINSKVIYLDLQSLYDSCSKKYYRCGFNMPFFQYVNQQIIITVFHELGHAIFLNMPSFSSSVSRNIINYILSIINPNDNFDEDKHDYFPFEKEAETFGYEVCLSLYQSMNKYFVDNESIRYLYIETLETLLNGYEDGYSNPLKKVVMAFLKDGNAQENYYLMQQDIIMSRMNLHERLRFGFPITYEELSYLKNILNYYKLYPLTSNIDMDIKKLILRR